MGLEDLIALLGEKIQDPDEESFSLFAAPIPSSNLGFLDPKASTLDLTVNGQEVIIAQSPSLLSSSLPGGTTGAVVWKITPLFAEWISSPENPLFTTAVLGPESTVLELGAGISGLLALTTAPKVEQYVTTDQEYVMKLLRQNINDNLPAMKAPAKTQKQSKAEQKRRSSQKQKSETGALKGTSNITILPLDWETSATSSLPSVLPSSRTSTSASPSQPQALNAIFALDCIYNESLVKPFVRTCVELARLEFPSSSNPSFGNESASQPTTVVIAQQLRSPDVFEEWLREFMKYFRVWRVLDEMFGEMKESLGSGKGFVVHIGVLKSGGED